MINFPHATLAGGYVYSKIFIGRHLANQNRFRPHGEIRDKVMLCPPNLFILGSGFRWLKVGHTAEESMLVTQNISSDRTRSVSNPVFNYSFSS